MSFGGRVEYPDLRRKEVELAARHRSGTILIEQAGADLGLVQDLRSNLPAGMTRPIGIRRG